MIINPGWRIIFVEGGHISIFGEDSRMVGFDLMTVLMQTVWGLAYNF